jgi:hypothetical protein
MTILAMEPGAAFLSADAKSGDVIATFNVPGVVLDDPSISGFVKVEDGPDGLSQLVVERRSTPVHVIYAVRVSAPSAAPRVFVLEIDPAILGHVAPTGAADDEEDEVSD